MSDPSNQGAKSIVITQQDTQSFVETTTLANNIAIYLYDQIIAFIEQIHISLDELLIIPDGIVSENRLNPEEKLGLKQVQNATLDEIHSFLIIDLQRFIEENIIAALHLKLVDSDIGPDGQYRTIFDVRFQILQNDPQQKVPEMPKNSSPVLFQVPNRIHDRYRAVLEIEVIDMAAANRLQQMEGMKLNWSDPIHLHDNSGLGRAAPQEVQQGNNVIVSVHNSIQR